MSVFKVTKSAPNTPMMKRHKRPTTESVISLSDDSDQEAEVTSGPPSSVQIQTALFEAFAKGNEKPPHDVAHAPSPSVSSANTMPMLTKPVANVPTGSKIRQKLAQFANTPDRRYATLTSDRKILANHNTAPRKSKTRLPSAPSISAYLDPVTEHVVQSGRDPRSLTSYFHMANTRGTNNPIQTLPSSRSRNISKNKPSAEMYRR